MKGVNCGLAVITEITPAEGCARTRCLAGRAAPRSGRAAQARSRRRRCANDRPRRCRLRPILRGRDCRRPCRCRGCARRPRRLRTWSRRPTARGQLVQLTNVWAPLFCSVSAVTALTAIGTSDSAWLRRVAVITMSPVSTGCRSRRLVVDRGVGGGRAFGRSSVATGSYQASSAAGPSAPAPTPALRSQPSSAPSSHTDLRFMIFSPLLSARAPEREANSEQQRRKANALTARKTPQR